MLLLLRLDWTGRIDSYVLFFPPNNRTRHIQCGGLQEGGELPRFQNVRNVYFHLPVRNAAGYEEIGEEKNGPYV